MDAECSIEVRHISVFMHPATLAVDNDRAPQSGARHGEAVAREEGRYAPVRRVLGSEPLSLRTHRHRGRSRPLRSAVVEYQAPSVASDSNFARGLVLQAGTRDTLSYKHRHQPTGPHDHVSGPLVKFDMGHYIRRGPGPLDPIGYLDRKRDHAYNQRVIVTSTL